MINTNIEIIEKKYWLSYDGKTYQLWTNEPRKHNTQYSRQHSTVKNYFYYGHDTCDELSRWEEEIFELFFPDIVMSRIKPIEVIIQNKKIIVYKGTKYKSDRKISITRKKPTQKINKIVTALGRIV